MLHVGQALINSETNEGAIFIGFNDGCEMRIMDKNLKEQFITDNHKVLRNKNDGSIFIGKAAIKGCFWGELKPKRPKIQALIKEVVIETEKQYSLGNIVTSSP